MSTTTDHTATMMNTNNIDHEDSDAVVVLDDVHQLADVPTPTRTIDDPSVETKAGQKSKSSSRSLPTTTYAALFLNSIRCKTSPSTAPEATPPAEKTAVDITNGIDTKAAAAVLLEEPLVETTPNEAIDVLAHYSAITAPVSEIRIATVPPPPLNLDRDGDIATVASQTMEYPTSPLTSADHPGSVLSFSVDDAVSTMSEDLLQTMEEAAAPPKPEPVVALTANVYANSEATGVVAPITAVGVQAMAGELGLDAFMTVGGSMMRESAINETPRVEDHGSNRTAYWFRKFVIVAVISLFCAAIVGYDTATTNPIDVCLRKANIVFSADEIQTKIAGEMVSDKSFQEAKLVGGIEQRTEEANLVGDAAIDKSIEDANLVGEAAIDKSIEEANLVVGEDAIAKSMEEVKLAEDEDEEEQDRQDLETAPLIAPFKSKKELESVMQSLTLRFMKLKNKELNLDKQLLPQNDSTKGVEETQSEDFVADSVISSDWTEHYFTVITTAADRLVGVVPAALKAKWTDFVTIFPSEQDFEEHKLCIGTAACSSPGASKVFRFWLSCVAGLCLSVLALVMCHPQKKCTGKGVGPHHMIQTPKEEKFAQQKVEDEKEDDSLQEVDLSTYKRLRKEDVKALLRDRQCLVGGNKGELIHRLVTHYREELNGLAYKSLQCRLKQQGLKATGKKDVLFIRLLEAGFQKEAY